MKVSVSLLGYALGNLAWEARRGKKKGPGVAVGPGSVALIWDVE